MYGLEVCKSLDLPIEFLDRAHSLRNKYQNDPLVAKWIDMAIRIEGTNKTFGVHAAGVVISAKPLDELVPVQRNNDGQIITQYFMEDIESLGLLKMDFLGLTNLTKTLLSRKRPYLYGNKASLNEKQKNDNQRSYFSGHTSTTAASWFMLAKIYQDYYPQDKRLPYIWSFSAVVPAITAYFRVKGGKHFYTCLLYTSPSPRDLSTARMPAAA